MSSVIAILTYRRAHAVRTFVDSILANCPNYPVAIFEDCGNMDPTFETLVPAGLTPTVNSELEADVYVAPKYEVYMGRRNVGVAGNSNRAIRWFMNHPSKPDRLVLCDDDLIAHGDFPKLYAEAHKFFGIGLWCFCDLPGDTYRTVEVRAKGRPVKIATRMTGMMMSITRAVIEKIGYFDTYFGRFGEEHCDFNNRARIAGFLSLNGQPQPCLDIPCSVLTSQRVPSSIFDFDKGRLDNEAAMAMNAVAGRYACSSHYRPYRLFHGKVTAGNTEGGLPTYELERLGYELVVDYDLRDARCLA